MRSSHDPAHESPHWGFLFTLMAMVLAAVAMFWAVIAMTR